MEEEELAGSNDDHDGTPELSIDRAGMLVFRTWLTTVHSKQYRFFEKISSLLHSSSTQGFLLEKLYCLECTRSQLQELYTSLYVSRDLDPDAVASDDTLQTFRS